MTLNTGGLEANVLIDAGSSINAGFLRRGCEVRVACSNTRRGRIRSFAV